MDMMISAGKSRKNVDAYVLMPPDSKKCIELLIKTRFAVGIRASNKYIFARLNSDTSLSGHSEMKDVAKECPGLRFPERINSRSLRKYIATVSQILDMSDSELQTLATHLGHDSKTHKEYYRLANSTIELSKVTQMLLATESGELNRWKGKTLNDIDMSDLPGITDDGQREDNEQPGNEAQYEGKDIDGQQDGNEQKGEDSDDQQRNDDPQDGNEQDKYMQDYHKQNEQDAVVKDKHMKRKWSDTENSIIKKKFRIQIEKNVPVRKEQLLEVQKLLNQRSLAVIRTKINNFRFGKST